MNNKYYCAKEFECIDIIEAYGLGFHRGNALKYILRAGHKGSSDDELKDLEKAIDYLQREIDVLRRNGTTDLKGLAEREQQ